MFHKNLLQNMKKLSIISLFFLFACSVKYPQSVQVINQEAFTLNGGSMLIGKCSRGALLREPYSKWFVKNHADYQVDTTQLASVKSKVNDITVTLFMGTWCGDTQREVPRFVKIQDYLPFRINYVMVYGELDRYKQSPTHEEVGKGIFRVPTFIVEKSGVEIGRIIESPVESLEKDLVKIINGEGYEPTYKGVQKLTQIIDNQGLNTIEDNLQKVAEDLKATLKNSSELNSYGYVLLGIKDFKKALTVFRLNTLLYPEDANTFDSLAEAYMKSGKNQKAIENYEKALSINPQAENAAEMLKKLKGV
jgi:tetratricopeptide (TPR) repeat protein